ncbi:alpha/beta hydrolase [Mycobacterium sp. NPDC003449]
MTFTVDRQVAQALAELGSAPGEAPAVGDVETRRANTRQAFERVDAALPPVSGVIRTDHTIEAGDGALLTASWYRPEQYERPGPAVLYLHGGGMIVDLLAAYDSIVRGYVAASNVPMLVVDYRVAPEYPHPTPVEDCFSAFTWLALHAAEFGVDPGRIAVMGDSAGGGLAAGVALLARDRGGPTPAQQILIYPMLDDRTTIADPQLPPTSLIWNYDDNITGWTALLGDSAGGEAVSPYAAPARAGDLSGLAPGYIEVGELDIFRDENIGYARRLAEAGVPTEFHLHPGCPHGFDFFAFNADVSRRAMADRVRRLRLL